MNLSALRCEANFALRRALRTWSARFLIEVTAVLSSLPAASLPPPRPRPRSERVVARSFPERRTLTSRDRVVVRAIAEAMFSQDGEVEPERLDAHLDEVDAYVSAASRPIRAGLRIALFVVSIAPMLLLFRMRRIDKLSVEDRVSVLSRLERSRVTNLSLMFIGWRTVMTLVFYENAEELRAIGYSGDERKVYKRRLPTLAVAPAPEESGVRLRGDHADDDEDEDHEHKVA